MSSFGGGGRGGGSRSFGKGGGGASGFGRGGGGNYSKGGKGGWHDDGYSGGRGRGSGKGGRGKGRWGGGKGKDSTQSILPSKQAVLKGHQDTVNCLAVSEAKSQLFSGSKDGTVRIWSWSNGFELAHTLMVGAPVEALLLFDAWLFAGTAAANGAQGVIKVWHTDSAFEQTLEGHQGSIYCLAQGGEFLFSGGDDTGVKTWKFANEKFEPIVNLAGHTSPIQVMKVAGMLLSADRGGTLIMWDLSTGSATLSITTGHTDILMALWVEESYLFTASLDGRVKVWNAEGEMLHEQGVTNQHNQPSGITALLLTNEAGKDGSAGEPVLVTACNDCALKLWRMPGFEKRGILAARVGHSDIVRCLARGPGNSFFSGSIDHSILVWEFLN